MARRTELRRLVEVLHHRGFVPLRVRRDLRVAHLTRHRLARLIRNHRRNAHHVTAQPIRRLQLLDRVAHRARNPIIIKPAIRHHRVRRHCARQQRNRRMTSFTMPRRLRAFCLDQQVYILAIEGCPKRIRMQRLTPLVVRSLVAVPAILRRGKCSRLDKIIAFNLGITRQKRLTRRNLKTVALTNPRRILRTILGHIRARADTLQEAKEKGSHCER